MVSVPSPPAAGHLRKRTTQIPKNKVNYLNTGTLPKIPGEGGKLRSAPLRRGSDVKMKKTKKTNAARILDELGIPYRLQTYPVDEEHLDAVHVAHEVGMLPEQTFKTLCIRGDKTGVLFAVIPGNGELDLKALARVSGNKRCEMVHLKELLPLTGYIRGGCSPLGAKKEYPVYLDETCQLFDEIAISAGMRGMQIIASPGGIAKATKAVLAALTME